MFEKLCTLIENALEWSETLISYFNCVAAENGLDADDDFDVIVELIAEELSVQIMLDYIILSMIAMLLAMMILGKLIKPLFVITISLYFINKLCVWIFDTWIFGLLFAYFFQISMTQRSPVLSPAPRNYLIYKDLFLRKFVFETAILRKIQNFRTSESLYLQAFEK